MSVKILCNKRSLIAIVAIFHITEACPASIDLLRKWRIRLFLWYDVGADVLDLESHRC